MGDKDLLLLFSLNEKTEELVASAENACLSGTKIAVCCCNNEPTLAFMADYLLLGYRDEHTSIVDYEVRSRLPLYVLARIVIEYLATEKD